jgi:hypothetical protein
MACTVDLVITERSLRGEVAPNGSVHEAQALRLRVDEAQALRQQAHEAQALRLRADEAQPLRLRFRKCSRGQLSI